MGRTLLLVAAVALAGLAAASAAPSSWREVVNRAARLRPLESIVVRQQVAGRPAELRATVSAAPAVPLALGGVVTCSSGIPGERSGIDEYRQWQGALQAHARGGRLEQVLALTVPPGRRARCLVVAAAANASRSRSARVSVSLSIRS